MKNYDESSHLQPLQVCKAKSLRKIISIVSLTLVTALLNGQVVIPNLWSLKEDYLHKLKDQQGMNLLDCQSFEVVQVKQHCRDFRNVFYCSRVELQTDGILHQIKLEWGVF